MSRLRLSISKKGPDGETAAGLNIGFLCGALEGFMSFTCGVKSGARLRRGAPRQAVTRLLASVLEPFWIFPFLGCSVTGAIRFKI
jgi:hypothetical protein